MGVMNGAPTRLAERDHVVTRLAERVGDSACPVTVLTGSPGSGRTSVLAAVGAALAERAVPVVAARVGAADRYLPYAGLFRLLTAIGSPAFASAEGESVRGMVARLSAGTDTGTPAPELAAAVAAVLRQQAPVVLLLDDVHWLDDATADLFARLTGHFAAGSCSVLATVRASADRAHAERFRRLVGAGAIRAIALRPLTEHGTGRVVAERLRAVPDDGLVRTLHAVSRGNPSALLAAIDGYQRARLLTVVDRTAYALPAIDPPSLPECHPLLEPARAAGPRTWPVAKAMAVLAPLGTPAAGLAADALGIDVELVRSALSALTDCRVLVRTDDRYGPRWRFRLPIVGVALRACLGPYERRELAALAVRAVWDGRAHPTDEHFLPDQLAVAGKLVDWQRASEELLVSGGSVLFTHGLRAQRWLSAVVNGATDPRQRGHTLMALSAAHAVHHRMAEATACARTVLRDYTGHLSPEQTQELEVVYLTGLAASGERDELVGIAEGTAPTLPGGPAEAAVNRAFALILLGRWREGFLALRADYDLWSSGNPVTADFGQMFLGGAGVVLGDPGQLYRFLDEPGRWRARHLPQHRFEQIRYEADMLLLLGELTPALRLLESTGTPVSQLPGPDRFMVCALRGEWTEAMEIARRTIVDGPLSARPVAPVMMLHGAIGILTAGGRLSRARELARDGRGTHLSYLIDHAESWTARAFGDRTGADGLLRAGLRKAEATGNVLGTEQMWADLAVVERRRGRMAEAQRAVERVAGIAGSLGTPRARIAHLLARAEVFGDLAAGAQAVERARERDEMPCETGRVLARAALAGVDTRRLLAQAYQLLGRSDALFCRARLRWHMREHGVPIPGRAATTTENERLLAILVTEGLTNRQLAQTLRTSEKSVEGRLSRMFTRIGYRSRVELAAAMLTGEYPG